MTEPRAYNGRNVGLLVVLAVVVMVSILNLAGGALRPKPHSPKVVTTVTPSP